MSNPYEAFDISDDQQDQKFVQNKGQKTRKTHKQRRQFKKQGATGTSTQPVNTEIPTHLKESGNEHKHKRQGGRPIKGIPAGHTHDRRSGTGREDRPRKQGGGFGNVGNVKDELNKEKYQKVEEKAEGKVAEETPVEQTKPQEPEKPTLAEYYQSKGVDINSQGVQRKAPVKGEINAEWIKKQKLTLVETKEDKKRQEGLKQNILQHTNTRVEMGFGNSQLLGFGTTKQSQKPREEQHHKGKHQKGAKGQKVVLKEDDFPAL